MRTDRRDDRRLSPGVLGDSDRTGHQTQGDPDQHGNQRRPYAARIFDPLARDHRPAVEHAHRHGRRSDHDTPAQRFRTLDGRNRNAGQRLDHLGRDRHGLRLLDRQAAGSRPLLHQPDGSGLRRAGHRRAHAPERHHGKRHQGQAAHEHARFGVGRTKPRSPRRRSSRWKRRWNTSRRTNTSKLRPTPCACARSC